MPKMSPMPPCPRSLGDAGEIHRAGEAVNQRGAVEQHARGQRAEDEVFQARFRRFQVVTVRGGDDVKRKAHQLEAEIERDQIGGGNEHHHAQRRQKNEHSEFEFLLLFRGEIVERQRQRPCRANDGQQLEKASEVVDDKAAAEQFMPPGGNEQHRERHKKEDDDAGAVDGLGARLAADHAGHQQHHGAAEQYNLRQQRHECRKLKGLGHRAGARGLQILRELRGLGRRQRVIVIVEELRHRSRREVEHRLRGDPE